MKVLESPTPAPATGRHAPRLEALGRSARLRLNGETRRPAAALPPSVRRHAGMEKPVPAQVPPLGGARLVIPTVIPTTAYLAVSGCLLRSNRTPPNSRKRSS